MKGETQRDRNFIDKLANDDKPILRKLSSGGKLDEGKDHYLKLTADFLLMIDSYPKRTRNVVSHKPKKTCQNKENVDDIEIKKIKREDSIHRAMNELESMISLNMHDKSKVVGFTLTYNDTYLEKHSRDPEQYKKVGDDFEYFIKKIKSKIC